LRIPFFGSAEQEAAAASQKKHIAEIYAAEQQRQSIDIQELAAGGMRGATYALSLRDGRLKPISVK
jgi:hypothetical protein